MAALAKHRLRPLDKFFHDLRHGNVDKLVHGALLLCPLDDFFHAAAVTKLDQDLLWVRTGVLLPRAPCPCQKRKKSKSNSGRVQWTSRRCAKVHCRLLSPSCFLPFSPCGDLNLACMTKRRSRVPIRAIILTSREDHDLLPFFFGAGRRSCPWKQQDRMPTIGGHYKSTQA